MSAAELTGDPCERCGMGYDRCTDRILRLGIGACCGGCQSTDTHNQRRKANTTAVAEVPAPRMDEPGVWETVAARTNTPIYPDAAVFVRFSDGLWRRCSGDGNVSLAGHLWNDLIDPRPTTPTERATSIVGGEDQ